MRFLRNKKDDAHRGSLKRPGFSSVVIMTLALAIGGITTIFTVLYTMQMKSLSISRPDLVADAQPPRDVRASRGDAIAPSKRKATAASPRAAMRPKRARSHQLLTQTRKGSGHGQSNQRHPLCAAQSVAASRLHSNRARDTRAGNRDQCGVVLNC